MSELLDTEVWLRAAPTQRRGYVGSFASLKLNYHRDCQNNGLHFLEYDSSDLANEPFEFPNRYSDRN
jgi:hypothetical protein